MEDLFNEISPKELKKTEKRMRLASRIYDGMKAKGWSNKDFAKAMEKYPSEISKWLSGTHKFNSDTLFDIESVLDIDLFALLDKPKEKVVSFCIEVQSTQQTSIGITNDSSLESYMSHVSNYKINTLQRLNSSTTGIVKIMKKEKEILFQLKGLELLDVKLVHQVKPLPSQLIFNFDISLEHRINVEKKMVVVVTSVAILHEDKNTLLGSIKASCVFEIQNILEFVDEKSKEIKMPNDILTTLNSISISTVRGIMFSQFKGTFLHNAHLPLVNPKGLEKN